jgi:hypothetical protein
MIHSNVRVVSKCVVVGVAVAGFVPLVAATATCGGNSVSYCMPGTSPVNGVCAAPDGGGLDATQPDTAMGTNVPDGSRPSDSSILFDTSVGPEMDSSILDASADRGPVACPTGRGPDMALLPAPEAGSFCIDTTEVTMAQYQDFLAADASPGLPSVCAKSGAFAPQACAQNSYDPVGRADYPVTCVNWCDAYAFCQWAGKELCGTFSGQPMLQAWSDSPWTWTCNSGTIAGGNGLEAYCNFGPAIQPVKSSPQCHGDGGSWSEVYDLLGNAAEFVSFSPRAGSPPGIIGGGAAFAGDCDIAQGNDNYATTQYNIGFRCCATF